MRTLVDTNILLRIVDPSNASHHVAVNATTVLRRMSHKLVIVPQTIYEFWAVSTRSLQANGLGMTPAEADELILEFCDVFCLLRDERTIFERWQALVTSHQIRGVNSYDVRLVAAMERHGIQNLLTLNPTDFRRFGSITVIDPNAVQVVNE